MSIADAAICRWRYPFADDTKDVAEAQVPHQATVEDAEDEDGHDDDNVGGNKIMDNEATLVIQHVAVSSSG